MALITCPECQKQVSEAARSCPHCGHPLGRSPLKAIAGAIISLITAAAVVAIVLVVATNSDEGKEKWTPTKLGKSYATGEARTFGGIEFVWIPPGTFQMGSPGDDDLYSHEDEMPAHWVTISSGFWLGKYEITIGQWRAVTGTDLWPVTSNPQLPAFGVSWHLAREFIDKLNQKGEGHFRFPTEAEWEYACRAGTRSPYYWGDDYRRIRDYAWTLKAEEYGPHSVGQKKSNAWALYDMVGTVYEWCEDWYDGAYYAKSPEVDPKGPSSGEYRVLRGGAWDQAGRNCTSSHRTGLAPNKVRWSLDRISVGFRVARDP